MNEVGKMYKNAGVEKIIITYYCNIRENEDCPHENDNILCKECVWGKPILKYPPFTAEKQLELIKLLMEQEDFSWAIAQQGKDTEYAFYVGYEYSSGDFKEFTEALVGIVNNLWQDLTTEEKQQVKEILE